MILTTSGFQFFRLKPRSGIRTSAIRAFANNSYLSDKDFFNTRKNKCSASENNVPKDWYLKLVNGLYPCLESSLIGSDSKLQ